jgi:hypothetical protein
LKKNVRCAYAITECRCVALRRHGRDDRPHAIERRSSFRLRWPSSPHGNGSAARRVVVTVAAWLVLDTPGRWGRIPTARPRAFNQVPGFEAVPFEIRADAAGTAVARLHVR